MKYFKFFIAIISLTVFISCEKGVNIGGGQLDNTKSLSLINWTGHWDEICSPGQTLTFVVNVGDDSEEYEIIRDSGNVYKGKIEEGDLVKIQVLNERGTVILNGQKNFSLVDTVQSFLTVNSGPAVVVCDIGELLFTF